MEPKQDKAAHIISQGVDALIERLKQDGVNAGKEEAARLIHEAEEKSNIILNTAQAKSKAMMDEAHQLIQQEKKAAEDALQLAARNMRLELRQNLIDRFTQEVKRLVHKELDNENMLRQLVFLVATDTVEQLHAFKAKNIEIELPQKVMDFDEIRKNPELLEKDPLKTLVQSLTRQMLREGMSVRVNQQVSKVAGIKVHLVDEEIVLDLTEDAVSNLLVKHMQPRFRALLEGLLQ
jgi:V/A-type H+-transporting ATPase subunit E